MDSKKMVSERRNYKILTTEDAKKCVSSYLTQNGLIDEDLSFGLPEIIDRFNIWNVPILYSSRVIGEIAVEAYTGNIDLNLSSNISVLHNRIELSPTIPEIRSHSKKKCSYVISSLENTIIKGRAELALGKLPEQSIDMIFTSPPYYNAKKQYSEFATYQDYLNMMRQVIQACKRVLIDGKFFIINSSHVLVPRATRNESSRRIAVPFDLHQIFMEEGFEFIDDIIWQKPEGAGWASGRGRRFSADRNPMQYKAVPVTEYVMVYRKKPAILIDHFIRNHPDPSIIEKSKIADGYEKTNIWYICPAHDKRHPAVFPAELAEKVITYYSFVNDVVLDPFGGIGTTAKAAMKLKRRFCSIEVSDEYIESTFSDLGNAQPNIFNEIPFEYIDYTHLPLPTTLPHTVEEKIRELRRSGISEELILEALSQFKTE